MSYRFDYMLRRDFPRFVAIERQCHEQPQTEAELLRKLRKPRVFGIAAWAGDEIVGFVIYERRLHHLEVTDLAIAKEWRNQGAGEATVGLLKRKMTNNNRYRNAFINVNERNVRAQLFLKHQGFRATKVIRGDKDDLFRMQLPIEADAFAATA